MTSIPNNSILILPYQAGKFLVDVYNNNRISIAHAGSIEKAVEILSDLHKNNCSNTLNCENLVNCHHCSYLVNSTNCSYCSHSGFLTNCSHLFKSCYCKKAYYGFKIIGQDNYNGRLKLFFSKAFRKFHKASKKIRLQMA